MTPAVKYPVPLAARFERSWRKRREIRSPGMAMSPRPRILNWPGRSLLKEGIFNTMGTLWPVPPPVATSIITDFLKIRGDKKTQKMSKKKVQMSNTVPTFKFGSRSVRWIVNKSITAMLSCNAQPKSSLLRKTRKPIASITPADSASASALECSWAQPNRSAILFGRLIALVARMAGHHPLITGSRSIVVVDTAPVAKRKRRM
mmetsp:Transcript_17961/g.38315  ORF Transcript_17961/g.38315 Transcript_17961/m.38315 type:complete len:203 (-) Transcript_17961:837-1445(-)